MFLEKHKKIQNIPFFVFLKLIRMEFGGGAYPYSELQLIQCRNKKSLASREHDPFVGLEHDRLWASESITVYTQN